MGIILVGAGVAFDLTLSGVEALKSCDKAYIETYTNPMNPLAISDLEALIGKKVEHLERSQVESSFLLNEAVSSDICVISSGDPLTATTHITLLIDAKRRGIPCKVIHNSSIHSVAPARAGLQVYRFGKTASLVNPRPNYKPTSSLDIIRENLARDLHTLVLLDTEPEPMEASYALEMLNEFDKMVVLSKVGHPDERISYGTVAELKKRDLGKAPFTIIVPARLHVVEEEFLQAIK